MKSGGSEAYLPGSEKKSKAVATMVLVTVAFLCLGSSLLLSFAALPTAFSFFFFLRSSVFSVLEMKELKR
jgi:hypothetical protein